MQVENVIDEELITNIDIAKLSEFNDIIFDTLVGELPLIINTIHHIDLIFGAKASNKTIHRLTPVESIKLTDR